ncbi:TipAS antibiotic-recognition domain-containing protein [soil metagenome]
MDWSIQEVARLAGTTSRTLRHYGDVGLLEPSRIGGNGYRYYDERALARLQRILMLRDLGLGIPAIARVLDEQRDDAEALVAHLRWLRQEQDRLERQIAAVETTIRKREGGEQLMAEEMLEGFDHTQYKQEVEQRWGAQAYAAGDRWWSAMSKPEQAAWMQRQKQLAADWAAAAEAGEDPHGEAGQALARRQADWLGSIPGTPGHEAGRPTREYFVGLAGMYVADERFAANYGGVPGAAFVRDAMLAYAEAEL